MNGFVNKEKTFYIYRHIRHDKNEPFYVGKGVGYVRSRKTSNVPYYDFYSRAFSPIGRNKIWRSIASRTTFDVEIIFETNEKNEIDTKEKEFIRLYGKKIKHTGTLANLTDGGDGISEHGEAYYESVKKRRENGVYKKVGRDNSRPVYVYSLKGEFLKKYNSKRDLAKSSDGDNSVIFDSIKGKRSYKGYFLTNFFCKNGIDIGSYRVSATIGMDILQINGLNHIVKVFRTKTDAAKEVGAKSLSGIDIAIRKGTISFGYYWKIVPSLKIFNNGNYNL